MIQHVYRMMFAQGVRGGAVGRGIALKAGRSRVRFALGSLEFPVDLILVLGWTQPLTEINTRDVSWGGGKGVRCIFMCQLS